MFCHWLQMLTPSKHSSWWRRLSSSFSEDVLKTSSRRLDQDEYVGVSLTSSADVFKTSSRRLGQDQYICLGHMSLRRLQDIFKTSSRRLQNLFKTSSRRLQDVFKTFWRRLQDVFKTSSRRPAKISSRRFQGVSESLFSIKLNSVDVELH